MKRIEVDRKIIDLYEGNYLEVVEYYPEYYVIKYKGETLFTTSYIIPMCYEFVKASLTHKLEIKYGDMIKTTVNLDTVNTSDRVKEFWIEHVKFILNYLQNILRDTDLIVAYDKYGFNVWERYNDDVLYVGDAYGVLRYVELYKEL